MQNKGGLPAIPKYEIERHYWLHELTQNRAKCRIHGCSFANAKEKAKLQRELCKSRKEYYGKS